MSQGVKDGIVCLGIGVALYTFGGYKIAQGWYLSAGASILMGVLLTWLGSESLYYQGGLDYMKLRMNTERAIAVKKQIEAEEENNAR